MNLTDTELKVQQDFINQGLLMLSVELRKTEGDDVPQLYTYFYPDINIQHSICERMKDDLQGVARPEIVGKLKNLVSQREMEISDYLQIYLRNLMGHGLLAQSGVWCTHTREQVKGSKDITYVYGTFTSHSSIDREATERHIQLVGHTVTLLEESMQDMTNPYCKTCE